MKMKDILTIALIAIVSLPLTVLVVFFLTGNARVEFGPTSLTPIEKRALALITHSARKDSLAISQSKTFLAVQNERAEVEKEREKLRDQQEHITMLNEELEALKEELSLRKKEIEGLVSQTASLEQKRIKDLSKVYGAMRAPEAAAILETLDDALVGKILMNLSDDRQKAKILSALTPEKATRVSNRLSKQ
jgi:flagellar motility protein MotE (MotC chaperone)